MKKNSLFLLLFFSLSCSDIGRLKLISDLPKELEEVSGTEVVADSNLVWMLNDGGNKAEIYGVSNKGKIVKELSIKSKNNDWEDLTSDENGNVYIGDFGNNENKRKNLAILKIKKKHLSSSKKIDVKKIKFYYPNQDDFPPKKKKLFFDSESFFYYKNSFYIFTKSRVEGKYGKTSLYKIPAKEGKKHKAEFVSEFNNCNDANCWITSADISPSGKKVALLSPEAVLIFTDFKNDDFLSGKMVKVTLDSYSQKEAITFKDENTLLITDEKAHNVGGNFYELKI
ncbi:hypothetical protein [Polaribacter sargassicola]|uniref:hypothetical protein n=1 Tax=Polaribacter sargassicola TaxID=2836891 RepID=UPI001F3DA064|nr:hypothetical protein [Polaribacter sp. DS7-9]